MDKLIRKVGMRPHDACTLRESLFGPSEEKSCRSLFSGVVGRDTDADLDATNFEHSQRTGSDRTQVVKSAFGADTLSSRGYNPGRATGADSPAFSSGKPFSPAQRGAVVRVSATAELAADNPERKHSETMCFAGVPWNKRVVNRSAAVRKAEWFVAVHEAKLKQVQKLSELSSGRGEIDVNRLCAVADFSDNVQISKLLKMSPKKIDEIAKAAVGKNSLMIAAEKGHTACVEFLLGKNAQPNLRSQDEYTALIRATERGHTECVRVLLRNGAEHDVKAPNWPLCVAATHGHADCMLELLERKADPERTDGNSRSPLVSWTQFNPPLVSPSTNHLQMITLRKHTFFAAQIIAAFLGKRECVSVLLERGAKVDRRDDRHRTAFMMACHTAQHECIRALVAANCNQDAEDNMGNTGRMMAKPHTVNFLQQLRQKQLTNEKQAELELFALLAKDKKNVSEHQAKKKKRKKKQNAKGQHDADLTTQSEETLDVRTEHPESESEMESAVISLPEPALEPEPPPQEKELSSIGPVVSDSQRDSVAGQNSAEESWKKKKQKKKTKKKKKKATVAADAEHRKPDAAVMMGGVLAEEWRKAELAQQEENTREALRNEREKNALLEAENHTFREQLNSMRSTSEAQSQEFSSRIEEAWEGSEQRLLQLEAARRDKDSAQLEAAQYRQRVTELEKRVAGLERSLEAAESRIVQISRRPSSEKTRNHMESELQKLRREVHTLRQQLEKSEVRFTMKQRQYIQDCQHLNAQRFKLDRRLANADRLIRSAELEPVSTTPLGNDERHLRAEYCLQKLHALTQQWVSAIGTARGLQQPRAYLFAFGSFRLGVDDIASDVDIMVMVPPEVDRIRDFFGLAATISDVAGSSMSGPSSLVQRLRTETLVRNLVVVADAYVPCIKLRFAGVDIDLTFSNTLHRDLPEQADFGDETTGWKANPCNFVHDSALADGTLVTSSGALVADLPAIRSLNGVRATHFLLHAVPHYELFRLALLEIKAWAKDRGIYGSMMGYLGGIAWSLLLAYYCNRRHEQNSDTQPPSVSQLTMGFFQYWAAWPWPACVELVPCGQQGPSTRADAEHHPALAAELWQPGNCHGDSASGCSVGGATGSGALLPILSPTYPQMNTAFTVSLATANVIKEEIAAAAAAAVPASVLRRSAAQPPFLKRYKQYLRVEVYTGEGGGAPHGGQWLALAKASLRHIINQLQLHPVFAKLHPHPKVFHPATLEPLSANGCACLEEAAAAPAVISATSASGGKDAPDRVKVTSRQRGGEGHVVFFLAGLVLADGVTGLGNYAHAEKMCVSAVDEVSARLLLKAKRGGWYTEGMALAGSVVSATTVSDFLVEEP